MIIQYIIDKLISDKIKALNFTDRYAGVVSEMEITTNAVGAAKSYKKYPIAAGVSANDCNNPAIYQDLVPNDTKKSVIYWELTQPMQNVGRTPQVGVFNQQRYRGTARVVVWLNLKELGFSEVAPQNRTDGKIHTLPALMKAIKFDGKFSDGIYSGDRVQIIPTRVITDKTQIFGKYGYSKDTNWFLYPYDFFAIDVSFTLDTCLSNPYEFPLGTAIDCVDFIADAPPAPTNNNSFVFDGVNEYIQAPVATELDFDYNEAFSISIWVKNVSSGAFLIGKSNVAVTKAYFVRLVGNLVAFSFTNSPQGFSIRTVASLDTSVWNHIIVTNDLGGGTANMKIYINGVLQPTTIVTLPAITSSIKNTSSLFLGGLSVSNLGSFTCANARLWNIKLDAADVLEEYNSGVVRVIPTQGANCVYNPDFDNATWDGLQWNIPDLTGVTAGYTSINMEEADRISDVPS